MLQLSPTHPDLAAAASPTSARVDQVGPPRICFPFGGGTVGGSHISATQLIHRLDRSRFTPIIVLHHGAGQLSEFLRGEGLEYITLPDTPFFGNSRGVPRPDGASAILRACAAQWQLADFLKRQHVRIVHTNEGAMHVSWALPARLAGARLLWHHRGMPEQRGVRFLAPLVADRIVGVSDYALSQIRRMKRAAPRTAVVYSPFDTQAEAIDRRQSHDALTAELGLDPATRLIGFFGNLVERKRPLLFVEMLAQVATARPDLPFMGLMFGSPLVPGMDAQVLDRAKALGVADRLRLMGFRYPSAPLMAGCDIHAVPAMDEPFGRSLIEAMLLGTPVVAAASGGNIEAIDHGVTGMLSAPDDPSAMAAAILELLDRPDHMAAIAANAFRTAGERYGADRHVSQISAIYQSLLDSGTAGARRP